MANTAVTLTSNTVATVTVEGDHEAIEVVQLAGTTVAVWDRALSDADVALLSAGFPVVP